MNVSLKKPSSPCCSWVPSTHSCVIPLLLRKKTALPLTHPSSSDYLPTPLSYLGRFREKGVSERLYKEAFEPMLLVGLFAPGEQCSAAGALGMLYYFILAVRALLPSLPPSLPPSLSAC